MGKIRVGVLRRWDLEQQKRYTQGAYKPQPFVFGGGF